MHEFVRCGCGLFMERFNKKATRPLVYLKVKSFLMVIQGILGGLKFLEENVNHFLKGFASIFFLQKPGVKNAGRNKDRTKTGQHNY